MISVDTNVIVRLLAKDDIKQFQQSLKLFQEKEIFICDTVILEMEWVLRFAYKFSPSEIYQAFTRLFGLPNVYLANANAIAQVLEWHQAGLDFADAFYLAQSQHCSHLYTFDRKFLQKANNLTECEVKQPKLL
ncbi:MAG: type II toxin-antitoxin system VapC family toxin [Cyanobacteria bacterium P01_A01_bin.68]